MAYKIHSVVFLIALFVTASCSQKGSNVKLEISHNFAFGNSAALQTISGGGLMVWGNSSNGSSFAQSLGSSSDDMVFSLPNGSWTFYAMAWDGSKNYVPSTATNHMFGGVVRCAKSAVVNLSGSPASVDLNLNNSNCTDAVFAGAVPTTTYGGNVVLPPTQFTFCRGLTQIVNGSRLCTDSRLDNRQGERKAWIGSFKVHMKGYTNFAGSKTAVAGLSSPCTEMTGDQELPTSETLSPASVYGGSNLKVSGLPAGGPGLPFQIEIEMFPGNSKCDDAALSAEGDRGSMFKVFPNGITTSESPAASKYFPYIDATNSKYFHKQYLQVTSESICNGRNSTGMDDHPFAAGEGTQEHPYIICSVPQFHSINNSSSFLALHYKLESNLDFNPYSQGLAGSGVVPTVFGCLEFGSNFMPIGYYAATCAAPGSPMAWGTLQNFTGSFNGGAYKLSNLRLREKNLANLGIFASINGNASVGNFNVENVELEGKHTVGLIAGIGQGSTNAASMTIWSINAVKSEIQARYENVGTDSQVGGMFGRLDKASLFRVSIKDSSVRGANSKVGGVIGHGSTLVLNEVAADVNIDANSSISPKYYVGGVIGLADDVNMDYVKHEGGIFTNANKVGGIAGYTSNTTNLTNFYANSFVLTNDGSPANFLGGVVGSWDSNGASSIGPGLTMSIVQSPCISACTQGSVAGNIGTTPGTLNTIYTLTATETGKGGSAPSFTSESTIANIAGMRTLSNFPALPVSGAYNWAIVNGEYPRFDFENHPCISLSGSGAGTQASPRVVCNEAQYLNLGSTTSGSYHKLAGNIRLSIAGTTQYDIPTFDVNLDGANKIILGGQSVVSGLYPIGHIGTITAAASIKNLQIQGMSRESNASNTITNPHGTFATINNGKISNVHAWSRGKFSYTGSNFVGINSATGEMRDIKVDGELLGYYQNFAPLAVVNNGLIERAKTNTQMTCIENAGCHYFAGLVVQNAGSIKKTEMSSRLDQNVSCPAQDSSMLVDTNTGLLEDIVVNEYTEFRGNSNLYYFHRQNNTGGVLRRVINNGRLKHDNNTKSAPMTGFPTVASAPSQGSGTHVDVLRSGGRSGKLLLNQVPFSCPVADRVDIPAWAGMPEYSAYDAGFFSSAYVSDGQKIILELDFGGGYRSTERGLTYNGPTNGFTVTATRCSSGSAGFVNVWYTEDQAIDLSGNGTSGVMNLQAVKYYTNYSTAFQAVMWDWNTPAHTSEKLGYYAYMLGMSTTPVAPRTWELEDNGELRLFDLD